MLSATESFLSTHFTQIRALILSALSNSSDFKIIEIYYVRETVMLHGSSPVRAKPGLWLRYNYNGNMDYLWYSDEHHASPSEPASGMNKLIAELNVDLALLELRMLFRNHKLSIGIGHFSLYDNFIHREPDKKKFILTEVFNSNTGVFNLERFSGTPNVAERGRHTPAHPLSQKTYQCVLFIPTAITELKQTFAITELKQNLSIIFGADCVKKIQDANGDYKVTFDFTRLPKNNISEKLREIFPGKTLFFPEDQISFRSNDLGKIKDRSSKKI